MTHILKKDEQMMMKASPSPFVTVVDRLGGGGGGFTTYARK
jgi:hypothetical protein